MVCMRNMAIRCLLFPCIVALAMASLPLASPFNRQSFPEGFIFGGGSAAYQNEGAAREDGKGPSIWDAFTHNYSEKITDHSNGDVATDLYHRYKDDIKLMKEMGLDSFRFSFSWSRILPKGKLSGGVNELGIRFYNNLINELLVNGIKPFVTLFHWDLPLALDDEYGGFLSSKIVDDYRDYVDLCFREFGDRVKYWATVNEPNFFSEFAYDYGYDAPGRCSKYIGNCTSGNSAIEPYQVTHNLLVAHATAVQLYKQRYQPSQQGKIGISVNSNWYIPINQTSSSLMAASRAFDFFTGWITDPITFGDYPKTMRSIVGNRLPKFTKEQSNMLKRSYDFIGINYYSSSYAADDPFPSATNLSYTTDSHTTLTEEKDGVPIGEPTALSWLYICPKGIRSLVHHLDKRYNNPAIVITENGYGDLGNDSLTIKDALKDYTRIKYHRLHLAYLLKAIEEGANVKGYFAWSLFDDFEWFSGYTTKFGLHFVDYKNGLTRYPKYSALWFKKFLQKRNINKKLSYNSI